ncbi:hypothetical protein F2Q69_00038402 [Brassica cretica]|uniref:Uncharacterized protein n=1 Tax=Brassica cretica TaxID=69181 RepID=A0A8S9SM97_BRACR|nr:hypothetical protein F2Q69_00038402 [Brassica cretica]
MPPPPARKEIVLALRAPSVVPVAQPKGRKRKFTKGGDGESSQQGDSSIASGLRGKFMSLIDGMISECGSEISRLAGELLELQGRWSETEAILTAVKDSHSVKVSKLEVAIWELERDLGKTASSLLKEKKTRKAISSEVRRLQRQIEDDAELTSRGIREAKDALRSEFQARLAKIPAFLGSLECIRNRDLALATIEGGMAVVQSFQSETPPTLEAEEARLSGCKGDLAVVDGDFDLILADLKSACFLPTCSEGPEGKDPVLGEGGGDAAPGLDEATGEEGAVNRHAAYGLLVKKSDRALARAQSLRSDRALTRARSLRSDRAEHAFGRCVVTFFELLSDVSCFLRKAFPPQLVRVETLARGLTILAKLGVLNEIYFKLRGREFLRNSKSFAFNMSSSHGVKRSFDVEMGESTSPAPIPTSPVEAPACVADHLSFRERLVRRQAEKEQVVTPRDAGTLAGSVILDASALPAGSSTTLILVEDKERAADSMPPPPARKEIALALRAPSVVPVAQPKGRKRKFTKGGDGESLQQGDSSIESGLRGKFMSLIDGMISECGSETNRLAGELLELEGRWSETEAMLTAVKDSHSMKVSKLERQIEGDAGLASRGIREAKDALRSEFQARLAKISGFLGSLECIRNRDLALATIEGGMVVVQSFQSETPRFLEAEEARLSGCKGDLAVVDGGKIRCSEKAEVMRLQAWTKQRVKRERELWGRL